LDLKRSTLASVVTIHSNLSRPERSPTFERSFAKRTFQELFRQYERYPINTTPVTLEGAFVSFYIAHQQPVLPEARYSALVCQSVKQAIRLGFTMSLSRIVGSSSPLKTRRISQIKTITSRHLALQKQIESSNQSGKEQDCPARLR